MDHPPRFGPVKPMMTRCDCGEWYDLHSNKVSDLAHKEHRTKVPSEVGQLRSAVSAFLEVAEALRPWDALPDHVRSKLVKATLAAAKAAP